MVNLIDTHFHIDHYKDYISIATRINELKQYTLCVTNSPGLFLSCKNTIGESKYLKFALGFHPLENGFGPNDLLFFNSLLAQTNYIGEIGLDYSRFAHTPRVTQKEFFDAIVSACSTRNKLMTVHIRQAEPDAIEIFCKHAPKKCIIHWFTGNIKQMNALLDLGCYFSVNPSMIASASNEKYKMIPTDRILVESDGPYSKVCGKRFSPDMLEKSYQIIADYFGLVDFEIIVRQNFQRLLKS